MQSYANTRCITRSYSGSKSQNQIFVHKKKTAYKITFYMSLTNKNVITEGLMTRRVNLASPGDVASRSPDHLLFVWFVLSTHPWPPSWMRRQPASVAAEWEALGGTMLSVFGSLRFWADVCSWPCGLGRRLRKSQTSPLCWSKLERALGVTATIDIRTSHIAFEPNVFQNSWYHCTWIGAIVPGYDCTSKCPPQT